MSYPPNCLADHDIKNNKGTITACAACWEELDVMTPELKAVVAAAVAVSRAAKDGLLGYLGPPEDIEKTDALDDAVDTLLAKQPEWGTCKP